MKFYNLDTLFTFGKHKGKTLKQIVEIENIWVLGGQEHKLADETSYINWCIINLENFCISESVYSELQSIKPYFKLSKEAIDILNEKREDWIEDKKSQSDFYSYDDKRYCGACMESPCMCSDPY